MHRSHCRSVIRPLAVAVVLSALPVQLRGQVLPPYDQLDAILKCLIEGEMSLRDIAALGHNPEVVGRVWRMLDRAEYKRRQAAPGVKLRPRAFGRDWRPPITNRWQG